MSKSARQATGSSPATDREVTDDGREIMQAVLAKPRQPVTAESADAGAINGVVIGTLADMAEDGSPMVYYPGIPGGQPLPAVSTNALSAPAPGLEVALGFVNGDPARPIVLGQIQNPAESVSRQVQAASEHQAVDVKLDGERLTLTADREIVLKCGNSSITLTRAGKIILKGDYLSTHSTGVNRIKGGSVQIN